MIAMFAFETGLGGGGIFCCLLPLGLMISALFWNSSRRRCPRCSHLNRDKAIFCGQCGQRLPWY